MKIPNLIKNKNIDYGTRVLVRSSLDVPIVDGKIENNFRIVESVRTLEWLRKRGARITVIGHLGREKESLALVHKELNKFMPVSFLTKNHGQEVYSAKEKLHPGEVLLLENTRIDSREERNEFSFVEELGNLQDIFVMDDFSASHREHASTCGLIEHLESYIGIRFYEELVALQRITERVMNPSVAIVGGAKSKTKLPLIVRLLDSYNMVFLGGITANTFLKARGFQVGKSAVEDIYIPNEILHNTNIITPTSVVVTKDFKKSRKISISEVERDDIIVDIEEHMVCAIIFCLGRAKTVVWNGPLGLYEKGFTEGSEQLSNSIKDLDIYSFVAGGDTVNVLEKRNMLDSWTFVSTGGGSVLTYLADGTLPVLTQFKKNENI